LISVAVPGAKEVLNQIGINSRQFSEIAQPAKWFDTTGLANPKEDRTVEGLLHRIVELALCQFSVPQCDVLGETFTPLFHVIKESFIERSSTAPFASLDETIKRPLEDSLGREQRIEFVPAFQIFSE
jgi:hypothetical protein